MALASPHSVLAADTENYKSWTGKYGDTVTLSRLAGENADETAAAISQEGFESSKYAIIARWDDFADALGASGLAGTLDCPILLTRLDKLSQATIDELKRLGTETVYVVGGTGAISEQIDADLDAIPTVKTHERIWGYYSWDTSLECAKAITEHDGNPNSEAIVAVSYNFQDALSISTYAYHYKVPLLLEDNSFGVAGKLTDSAVSFINNITGTIWVAGGYVAVREETIEGVFTSRTSDIQRLYGEDGYDTSNQIATYMLEHKLLSVDCAGIASGGQKAHGVDALAGAALVGKQGGVMLLANGNEAMEEVNYTTIDQEQDSQGTAAYLTTNQYEIKDAYVLGGNVVAPTAFFDKVYEILLWTPNPNPDPDPETHVLPTDGWSLASDTFTYDATAKTPAVTAPNGLKEGTDYTVKYTNNKDAGTATVTITGKGNYTGTKELTFTINPKTATIEWTPSGEITYTYDGDPHTPEACITGTIGEDGLTAVLSYTSTSSTAESSDAPTDAGNYTVTVTHFTAATGTIASNYVLPATGLTKDFTIVQATPKAPTGLTTTAYTNQTFADVALPALPEGFDGTLAWKDSSASTGTATGEITAIAIYTPANTNYKAVEVEVKVTVTKATTGKYWLATAQASDPEDESVLVKGQTEIDKDIAVLHGTDEQAKKAVTAEYTNYMMGKSADGSKDQEIRLYTKWYGVTYDGTSFKEKAENKYVEMRIIQVGEHDGDKSAVTFMAAHALPAGQSMNEPTSSSSAPSNSGSWEKSTMRTAIMSDYVTTGMTDIASAVLPLDKVTTSGSYDSWTKNYTTEDTFWLLSDSEVFGTGNNNTMLSGSLPYYYEEGSQYAWFTSQGVNAKKGRDSSNDSIASVGKTRSGSLPSGASIAYWWLRSPVLFSSSAFASPSDIGEPVNTSANAKYSVVPAFAM